MLLCLPLSLGSESLRSFAVPPVHLDFLPNAVQYHWCTSLVFSFVSLPSEEYPNYTTPYQHKYYRSIPYDYIILCVRNFLAPLLATMVKSQNMCRLRWPRNTRFLPGMAVTLYISQMSRSIPLSSTFCQHFTVSDFLISACLIDIPLSF